MSEHSAAGAAMERQVEAMRRLRAENGCPWDREQDLRSLRPYLLEEAHEVLDEMDRVGYGRGVRKKLDEELAELDQAIARGDRDELEHELGDVLFSLANLARFIKTPPEDALRQANRRFTERFHQIEAALRAEGVPFGQATLEQMD